MFFCDVRLWSLSVMLVCDVHLPCSNCHIRLKWPSTMFIWKARCVPSLHQSTWVIPLNSDRFTVAEADQSTTSKAFNSNFFLEGSFFKDLFRQKLSRALIRYNSLVHFCFKQSHFIKCPPMFNHHRASSSSNIVEQHRRASQWSPVIRTRCSVNWLKCHVTNMRWYTVRLTIAIWESLEDQICRPVYQLDPQVQIAAPEQKVFIEHKFAHRHTVGVTQETAFPPYAHQS